MWQVLVKYRRFQTLCLLQILPVTYLILYPHMYNGGGGKNYLVKKEEGGDYLVRKDTTQLEMDLYTLHAPAVLHRPLCLRPVNDLPD